MLWKEIAKLELLSGSTRIALIEPNRFLNREEPNRRGTDTTRTALRFCFTFLKPNEPKRTAGSLLFWSEFQLNPQVKLCQDVSARTHLITNMDDRISTPETLLDFLNSQKFFPLKISFFRFFCFFSAKSHRICSCGSAQAILATSAGSSESSVPSVICPRMSRRP